jgi:hypothetical protein
MLSYLKPNILNILIVVCGFCLVSQTHEDVNLRNSTRRTESSELKFTIEKGSQS